MFDLVSLGAAVTSNVPLPPLNGTALETVLLNYGTYHQRMYRNTGLDWLIKAEVGGERSIKMRFRTPFQDNFQYGLVVGFAQRMLPPGTRYTVYFDPAIPTLDHGGDETVIWVRWEAPTA